MSSDEEIFRGGCQCGAIRYEARGPAKNRCVCHCESCRRSAGAPGVPWATFALATLKYLHGTPTEFASSARVTRGFCGHCGTTLTYWHDGRADEIDLAVVTLDEPERLAPLAHIWMADRLSWEQPGDGLPQFAESLQDPA